MKTIQFIVTGTPKAQPRPKAFSRGGFTRVYDPGTAEGWKCAIAEAAKPVIPIEPLHGPLKMDLQFWMPRLKSHFKSNGATKDNAPTYHVTKPDYDNLEKAVSDTLTRLKFWDDDSQVCVWSGSKKYSNAPGVTVTIQEIC